VREENKWIENQGMFNIGNDFTPEEEAQVSKHLFEI
jgi:hypothetical protein